MKTVGGSKAIWGSLLGLFLLGPVSWLVLALAFPTSPVEFELRFFNVSITSLFVLGYFLFIVTPPIASAFALVYFGWLRGRGTALLWLKLLLWIALAMASAIGLFFVFSIVGFVLAAAALT